MLGIQSFWKNTGWRRGDNERGTRQRRSRELHADGAQPDSHPAEYLASMKNEIYLSQ